MSRDRAGRIPAPRLSFSAPRTIAGFVVAVLGGPLLTWLLSTLRAPDSITSDVLAYQVLVVVVALVGGLWPALFTALLSALTLDFFFIDPLYTVSIDQPYHLLALGLYLLGAVLVSSIVDKAERRSRAAVSAAAESQLLAEVAGSVLRGRDALDALLARTRQAFELEGVRLRAHDGELVSGSVPATTAPDTRPGTTIAVGTRGSLELFGRPLSGSDRRVLAVIVTQLDAALEHSDLSATAERLAPIAEADKVRRALLAAVGHDLRRPLTAATTAVGGLRATDAPLSDHDRSELLETAAESLDTLAQLVTDLLDTSRIQAGALAVSLGPVDVAEVVGAALDELDAGPDVLDLDVPEPLPAVLADGALLQRIVVNLISNALRFTPAGGRVTVSADAGEGKVRLHIADTGPGIPASRRDEVFVPFQRLGDVNNSTGLGLGLALSKGFAEGMGGTLEAGDTPGGGLTMTVVLPIAREGHA